MLRANNPSSFLPSLRPCLSLTHLALHMIRFSRKAAMAHKELLHIDTIDKHLNAVSAKHKPEGSHLAFPL